MKLSFALAGLAALGAVAAAGSASAMSFGLATKSDVASNIDQVRLVCDEFGRCFRTRGYGYGPRYGYAPRYGYGRGFDPHRDWDHHGWRRDRDDWHRDRGDWRGDRRW
jgi:hypothetical protein